MGTIKHNAIVVTGADYAMDKLELVYKKAQELFGSLVSPTIESHLNGYHSFFVAPDGSKERWKESNEGDRQRKELGNFIDSMAYEDGSNSIRYVDVSYNEIHGAEIEKTNRDLTNDCL
ncbi:hypothetical protein J5TS2_40750 [Brevibacillus halotolerans]|uniref:hypothetical protein n=1 Tax=Brevibacillus halotolerans TaxID=1507437 RepID=UPI001B116C9C|nr:hypothetical protein [Brevibacillus halotolerans]GIO03407.1 hypothetical protein J5TS2_40750 [Brevibacillus halotolerans]